MNNARSVIESMHPDSFMGEELKLGSDRWFGVLVGGVFAALGALAHYYQKSFAWVLFLASAPILFFAIVRPQALAGFQRQWMKLAILLGRLLNPITLGAFYLLLIAPLSITMRLFGRDPLRLKRPDPGKSLWLPRIEQNWRESFRRQF